MEIKISKYLIAYRKKYKISQRVMAKFLNTSQSQICRWEKGTHNPSVLRKG